MNGTKLNEISFDFAGVEHAFSQTDQKLKKNYVNSQTECFPGLFGLWMLWEFVFYYNSS